MAGDVEHVEKILVVSHNYAPDVTGIAPYTTALCEHLARTTSVTAVTGFPYYPGWRLRPEERRRYRRDELINTVDVRRRWMYIPQRQSTMRRLLHEISFGATGLPPALAEAPDRVIAIAPNTSCSLIAAAVSTRFKVPLSLQLQDLSALGAVEAGFAPNRRVGKVLADVERMTLSRAERISCVSGRMSDVVRRNVGPDAMIDTHLNWAPAIPSGESRSERRRALGWREDELVLLHAGNQGLKQDLAQLKTALSTAPTDVRIVLLGAGNQNATLRSLLASSANVSFIDPIPEADFGATLRAADALLVCERVGVRDMALPSKLGAYMNAAQPVVALVEPDSATAETIMRAGCGVIADRRSPRGLWDAFESAVARREALAEAGRAFAGKYLDRERVLDRLTSFLLARELG